MSKDGSLDYIYLQPAEAACPSEGRLWCEDDDPSGLDGPWVQYIRYDIHQRKLEEAKAEQSAELVRLRESADSLLLACIKYRKAYQHFGASDIRTGKEWDEMRHAEKALAKAL